MNKTSVTYVIIALVIGAIIGYISHSSSPDASFVGGAVTTDCGVTTCLSGGLRITSGDLSVVSTNSATSSIAVGCYQTSATSTATIIHLTFGLPTNATSTTQAVNSSGLVAWAYGACPI